MNTQVPISGFPKWPNQSVWAEQHSITCKLYKPLLL